MSEDKEELFIPYSTSRRLRDIGFDEPCMAAYDRIQMLCTHSKNVFERLKYSGNYTSAPTFEEAIEWFKKTSQHSYTPKFL